jgi:phospholipid-binding lipoprotein MlaA
MTRSLLPRARLTPSMVSVVLILAGCATAQGPTPHSVSTPGSERAAAPERRAPTAQPEAMSAGVADRMPRVNRAVYRFNRTVDRKLLRPVARGYRRVVPQPVERRVRNLFTNLRAPIDIVNNLLQGKLVHGLSDFGRFLLNFTVGIGGLFDPAAKLGLERHAEDFGQTLAVWGVPSGGYLMLPLLGPGTFRDWGAWRVDAELDALLELSDSGVRSTALAWRLVSDRAALLSAEHALEESFDEYLFVREAYLQHRVYEIRDGEPEDDDYSYIE